MRLHLTELEIEILRHRLNRPAAITQALVGEVRNRQSRHTSEEEVAEVARQLLLTVTTEAKLPATVTGLESQILRDCIDNSEIVADIVRTVPRLQGNLQREGQILARKIEDLTGTYCQFPTEILDWR